MSVATDHIASRPAVQEHGAERVCVVGSGSMFLSGVSQYTHRLSTALADDDNDVTVVLMRRLLPSRLYPGSSRVGERLARLDYPETVRVFNGVDWFWLPSLLRAARFLRRHRPTTVAFQWWTGTVLHSYIALALVARLSGARVVVEFHEGLDSGELRFRLARAYVRFLAPLFMRMAAGAVVHSEHDRAVITERYPLSGAVVEVITHGPYDHYVSGTRTGPDDPQTGAGDVCNLLFFGVIRDYKGLDDLVRAFDGLTPDDARGYHLTVVGETWEGCTGPAELIERSPHRDRITFVNRYVSDDEARGFFAEADAVVLPYRRSSASGPLHIAMACGLPVIVTTVGGLVEAVEGYDGAIAVGPNDVEGLRAAFPIAAGKRGRRYADPSSWETTASRYRALLRTIRERTSRVGVGL